MGFSVPPRLRLERWALTPPFHPCLGGANHEAWTTEAVSFLWHYPSGCLTASPPACIPSPGFLSHNQGLRGIAPFGVRTFLPRLAPEAILRLSEIDQSILEVQPRSKPDGANMCPSYSLHSTSRFSEQRAKNYCGGAPGNESGMGFRHDKPSHIWQKSAPTCAKRLDIR